ncbi:YggS family pyridoxal phosphate-dependent enzyme [Solemya velesiana gill symbiont]|uniref:Pyridoxal phosphate homeostasis protein n=1 Tax=Solemya velesiana gill symbiont TaxID=1918948 RepID=A0A1T2KVC4_9GAMM|nr:YggS family pyridoxal phosphate-dependent enzyme [Solemya velesiana gill symbiont]OOZ36795.1 YggS family pyridoxal phosphate enzyme [Solemya velesiana gill symbiont]
MSSIPEHLKQVNQRIREAAEAWGRDCDDIQLLAVSKTRTADEIAEALKAGQHLFGESYLQEALEKITALRGANAQWHYIGRVQSNKTRAIAENFDWVHSVDKAKQARRLNEQRPQNMPPLNVCLQIKVDEEESKGGLTAKEAEALIEEFSGFTRLRLRGLMTLPAPAEDFEGQRRPFCELRRLRDRLATDEIPLETLSMGMSADIEAAIAEGATIVRAGTAIFGPRNPVISRN